MIASHLLIITWLILPSAVLTDYSDVLRQGLIKLERSESLDSGYLHTRTVGPVELAKSILRVDTPAFDDVLDSEDELCEWLEDECNSAVLAMLWPLIKGIEGFDRQWIDWAFRSK